MKKTEYEKLKNEVIEVDKEHARTQLPKEHMRAARKIDLAPVIGAKCEYVQFDGEKRVYLSHPATVRTANIELVLHDYGQNQYEHETKIQCEALVDFGKKCGAPLPLTAFLDLGHAGKNYLKVVEDDGAKVKEPK